MRITNPSGAFQIDSSTAIPLRELRFEFSRGGGPGGQHVNKVSTRVDLLFDVVHSPSLSVDQKARIFERYGTRIDGNGLLRLTSAASRSQWKNREEVLRRFEALLRQALKVRARRVPTAPTRASKERRRTAKKARSQKKRLRSDRDGDFE
jgi:ribosome-associated protein